MAPSKFRETSHTTEVLRNGTYIQGLNFTIEIRRTIVGSIESSRLIVLLSKPGREPLEGMLSSKDVTQKDRFQQDLLGAFSLGGLVVSMTNGELAAFWLSKYEQYYKDYAPSAGFEHLDLQATGRVGWHDKTYIVNRNVQISKKGKAIPPERFRWFLDPALVKSLPMSPLEHVGRKASPVKELYDTLQQTLPTTAFLAAVLLGGYALAALHYEKLKSIHHQMAVTVLVGQPNTFKTFLGKVCASLLGVKGVAMYNDITLARLAELLGCSPFFVLNDPGNVEVFKVLITKAFEEGKTSNCTRESTTNTVPLVTCNAFLLKPLQAHGMRELSRLCVLPLVEEASADMPQAIDTLMNQAGESMGRLIKLGKQVDTLPVSQTATTLRDHLPEGDAGRRMATSYALLLCLGELFASSFDINVCMEDLVDFFTATIVPCGIQAHQVPQDGVHDSALFSMLDKACDIMGGEFANYVKICRHKFKAEGSTEAVAVRISKLVAAMNDRQSQLSIVEKEMKKEIKFLGGEAAMNTRFNGKVLSANPIPTSALPEDLYEKIKGVTFRDGRLASTKESARCEATGTVTDKDATKQRKATDRDDGLASTKDGALSEAAVPVTVKEPTKERKTTDKEPTKQRKATDRDEGLSSTKGSARSDAAVAITAKEPTKERKTTVRKKKSAKATQSKIEESTETNQLVAPQQKNDAASDALPDADDVQIATNPDGDRAAGIEERMLALLNTQVSAEILTIDVSSSGKVDKGKEVTITCAVDRTISAAASVLWIKRQGSITVTLASNDIFRDDYSDQPRYSISQPENGRYMFKIHNSRYEDSGRYECQLLYGGAGRHVAATLAVCKNKNSDSCKCMHKDGWANPGCFEEPDAEEELKEYQGAVIGLVICLVVVIVYAVVVTVYLYRDVIRTLKKRAEKRVKERRRQSGRHARPDDTHTLDLTDNTSMISGPNFTHVTSSSEHVDAAAREYSRLNTSHDYSPNGGMVPGHDYSQHGGMVPGHDYSQHGGMVPGHDYSQHGGMATGLTGYADVGHSQAQVNRAFEGDQSSESLPRYEQLPDSMKTTASGYNSPASSPRYPPHSNPSTPGYAQHPDVNRTPMYRNPPSSGGTERQRDARYADDPYQLHGRSGQSYTHEERSSNQQQSANRADRAGYESVRPKNSPPGASAFSPVQKEHKSHKTPTPAAGGMNESTLSTPAYNQHPAQYATYDGGLQNAGASASNTPRSQNGHTPGSSHDNRHLPASESRPPTQRPPTDRGAYSEMPKPKPQKPHMNANSTRHAQPKRLDFNTGGGDYGNGPYVSQQDTVI